VVLASSVLNFILKISRYSRKADGFPPQVALPRRSVLRFVRSLTRHWA
jgi:hypothetical protein